MLQPMSEKIGIEIINMLYHLQVYYVYSMIIRVSVIYLERGVAQASKKIFED